VYHFNTLVELLTVGFVEGDIRAVDIRAVDVRAVDIGAGERKKTATAWFIRI
jgi:hypothetical protein